MDNSRVRSHCGLTIVAADERLLVSDRRHVYGLERVTGRIAWHVDRGTFDGAQWECAPVAVGKVVYIVTASERGGRADSLSAFAVESGPKLWWRRIGHSLSGLIAHGGSLYVLDALPETQQCYLLKLSP